MRAAILLLSLAAACAPPSSFDGGPADGGATSDAGAAAASCDGSAAVVVATANPHVSQPGGRRGSLAVVGADALWVDASQMEILRAPLAGGAPASVFSATMLEAYLLQVASGDEALFWIDLSLRLWTLPSGASGAATQIATGGQSLTSLYVIPRIVVDDGAIWVGEGGRAIAAVPAAGGAPETVTPDRTDGHFAVNGGDVAWDHADDATGTVTIELTSGGTTTTRATFPPDGTGSRTMFVDDLALDDDGAIYLADGLSLWAVPPSGDAATLYDEPRQLGQPTLGPQLVAVDATRVLISQLGKRDLHLPTTGTPVALIRSIPKGGGAPTELYCAEESWIDDLTVDAGGITFLVRDADADGAGAVMRIPF